MLKSVFTAGTLAATAIAAAVILVPIPAAHAETEISCAVVKGNLEPGGLDGLGCVALDGTYAPAILDGKVGGIWFCAKVMVYANITGGTGCTG
jgi:hypothetical protein